MWRIGTDLKKSLLLKAFRTINPLKVVKSSQHAKKVFKKFFNFFLDTDDYARVALPTGPEEVSGQQADSSDVESVVEEEEPQIDGMIGFADLL